MDPETREQYEERRKAVIAKRLLEEMTAKAVERLRPQKAQHDIAAEAERQVKEAG